MTPRAVKAWACGACSKTFPHNEHGKRFADACCRCRTCGGTSVYMGTSQSLCRACHEKDVRQSVEAEYRRALEAYERTFGDKPSSTEEPSDG